MINVSESLFKTVPGFDMCRWLALNNPNYVRYIRMDYNVMAINTAGGSTNVAVQTSFVTQAQFEQDFTVGSQVYLAAINKTVTVLTRTYIGTYSLFTFNDGISYSTFGQYANCLNRVDYFIEVKYTKIVDTGTNETRIEKLVPFTNGIAETDISPALVKMLQLTPTAENLNVINIRDADASGRFFVTSREYYYGEYTSEGLIIPDFYGVNAQKKALERYGSCMAEYEMNLLSNNKFLTRMVKPHYWAGYPFALGWLFPLSIAEILVEKLEIEQDINQQTIESTSTPIELFNSVQNYEYMNSLTLDGGYTGDSVLVRLISQITAGGTVTEYAEQYANNYFKGFVIPPLLEIEIISEAKRVYIGKCVDSPVYLRWRNSLGYFDFWLFGKKQVKSNNVEKFETFNPLIKDIEFEQDSESVVTKDFNKAWVLGATLEKQSLSDIQELFTSPFVQWWNEDNGQWYQVKVLAGRYTYEITDEEMNEIEFTIEFPKEYNQSQ